MNNEEFKIIKETKLDDGTYQYTFECSAETWQQLADKYGTEDFEEKLSNDFEAYVMSIRESFDE